MNTSTIMQFARKTATVGFFAVAIFASYSAVGYLTDSLPFASAIPACGYMGCHADEPQPPVPGHPPVPSATNPSAARGCNITITKSANKTSVRPGELIEYTINYQNIGTGKCTGSGVIIRDELDSNVEYVSETHSSNSTGGHDSALETLQTEDEPRFELNPYIAQEHALEWNAYVLQPGEAGWIKLIVKVKSNFPQVCDGYTVNQAWVSSIEYYDANPNGLTWAWKKSNPVVVLVDQNCNPPQECELEITKAASETTLMPGDFVAYTIDFKNVGDEKCTGSGVKVADTLDTNLIYHSETHSSNVTAGYNSDPVYDSATRTVYWNAWDLDAGETGWVKVIAKAATPAACTTVVPNKAKITSFEYNNFNTWVYSNNVNVTINKDCTPPTECELTITKTANKTTVEAGDQIEYTLNFKNKGDAKCTGSGVKVTDTLDSRLTYVSETHSSNVTAGYQTEPVYKASNRTLYWNAWDLDPNETGWVKFKVTVGTPAACSETIPNIGKISSFEYNNFGTWVSSNTVNITLTKDCTPPPPGECELTIIKSANKTSLTAGQDIEYTITFKNTGNKKCTGSGVKVIDVVDSRLTYIVGSESRSSNVSAGYVGDPLYTSGTRTLVWNAWDLDPNETGWVKWSGKAKTPDSCSETVPNVAKITSLEYNNFQQWVESNVVNATLSKDCYHQVPYCTMSISPTSISSGQSATLSWNSTNVNTVTIDQGIGSVALSGSMSVSPTQNTTYTGTFTGPGGTITCTASITVPTHQYGPQCTLSVSASRINPGQSIFVSWTSTNAVTGFITGNVGTTTPVSGGSFEIYPSDDTTYVGTFTAANGQTVTCSAPVTLNKGGGGCYGNCGGGLNPPNVVLFQKPTEAPLAFVSLAQIPYTGFEAGFGLTVAFWAAVGLLAALAAYFVMGKGGIQFLLGNALQLAGATQYMPVEEERELPQSYGNGYGTREDSAAYSASVMAAPMPAYAAPKPVAPATDGIPEVADVIESRAHGAGVLMSPEAVSMALELSTDRGETLRRFGDILNEAVKTIPREDGWILLTSERFEALAAETPVSETVATVTSTPSVESILAGVMVPPAPVAKKMLAPHTNPIGKNVEMPMSVADDQSVVMSLAEAILGGNRDAAYATVRALEASGANASTVMTIIASAFDQLYRARRHGTTTSLTIFAESISDEVLSRMVEVFTHGMDGGYQNAFTGLKLAIAQAFEARG